MPSPKSALLLALLSISASISGGNAYVSVATVSADPTLVVLELPEKGSRSVMGQLDCNPDEHGRGGFNVLHV